MIQSLRPPRPPVSLSGPPPRPATNEPTPIAYRANRAMTSLVNQPARCHLWGDASFRGNCDGTLFKDLVLRYRPGSVADPMMGSGTTADVITGLRRFGQFDGYFWGSDLSRGFNLLTNPFPERFDLIWVHPPYWNAVRYSDDIADLSTIDDYDQFRHALATCLLNCRLALNPGGRLAVLIGDIQKDGRYHCLGQDVMSLSGRIGELRSVIIAAKHIDRADNRVFATMEDVPVKHEYCLVFKLSCSAA
jgi:hypothetical protein